MTETDLELCYACKLKLAQFAELDEIPGGAERVRCDNCHKMAYGGRFAVKYKNRRDKDV